MNEALHELGDYIEMAMGDAVGGATQDHDELILACEPDGIVRLLIFLRDDSNCLFKVLIDICGVDYPERAERFEVVYQLLSLRHNQRVRVKLCCNDGDMVPSAVGVFSTAGWFERETWDLYGIPFSDHPDLRRLLTDYGFDGHPMRKDFPLTGRVEMRYDEAQKRVIQEPVSLTQAFRDFDFMSPWEGANYLLPGDEKADEPGAGG